MSNQRKQKMQQYYVWPNPNLRAYLGRQRAGSDLVVTTPFAEGESDDEMLGQWQKHLERIRNEWPTLYDYEMEMKAKVGPLLVQEPLSARLASIQEYYNLPNAEPLNEAALAQCLRQWQKLNGLRRRAKQATIDAMKLSTNSGSPFFTRRKIVVEREFNTTDSLTRSEWVVDYTGEGSFRMCATLGWRGGEGGPEAEDVKQRDLWMFPMHVNIAELSYYQPLIQGAQKTNLMPPWNGNPYVDTAMTKLFDTKGEHELAVCTDFKSFDAHFGPVLQDAALYVLNELFKDNDLEEVLRFKYEIPLCVDVGQFFVGSHGMASGSGGTNADESIAHMALQIEAALRKQADLNVNSMRLGDDGVLSYPGITVEDVVESYTRHGVEMQPSKQYASEADVIFLRRWHHRDYRVHGICVGVYPTMRALGRLRYMERFMDPKKWGVKAVAMRELSVIENAAYHPLFPEFVSFCAKRDKYRLGLDIPGFMGAINDEFTKAQRDGVTYLSYSQEYNNPKPPSEWEVVKVLKAMK